MTYVGKITTRLRPDVDRRLRSTAILRSARITRVINDALDAALPSVREIRALVAETLPTDAGEVTVRGERA